MTKLEIRKKSSAQFSSFGFRHSFVLRHLTMPYLDQFLHVIVDQGGSDLHIGVGQSPKMRKHGDVASIRAEAVSHDEAMSMLSEVCGQHNWEIFEERGDLDFAYEMAPLPVFAAII